MEHTARKVEVQGMYQISVEKKLKGETNTREIDIGR
jgi:hypothetical protein